MSAIHFFTRGRQTTQPTVFGPPSTTSKDKVISTHSPSGVLQNDPRAYGNCSVIAASAHLYDRKQKEHLRGLATVHPDMQEQ